MKCITQTDAAGALTTKEPRKLQRGFTILELTLVLVIAGVLIAAAYVGYQQLFAGAKAEAEAAFVNTLAAQIRKDNRSTSDFSSISIAKMVARNVVPEKLISSPTTLMNGWNGAVTITGIAGSFTITWPNVPKSACLDFVSATAPAFSVVTVGGVNVKSNGTLNTGATDTACAASDAITVVLTGS